jgi:RNA polymerase sigma-70 factor, ECF subfamily
VASDGDLFRRSERDPGAFEEIFERHAASVSRYVRRRIGREASEEIVAETFLIAFDRRARFDPTYPSARPWLLGIATNLLRRHLREKRARLTTIARLADPPSIADGREAARLDAERARPVLLDALAALSDEDRETFLLVALGELTYAEAAAALEIPVGTVRSRMHRVRSRLRERLPGLVAIDEGGDPPLDG